MRFIVAPLRHVFRAAPWHGAAFLALLAIGGLVPIWTIGVTRVLVDALQELATEGVSPKLPLYTAALALALSFAVDFLLSPWTAYVQGTVNERLTARVQLDLMDKAAGLPDLGHFENEKFYNKLQVLRDGAKYQPLNVLVFLGSALRETVTAVGVLGLLFSLAPVFPLLLLLAMLPPTILGFRLQQGVWDASVSSAPEARRLHYLSGTMLDVDYGQEVRLFHLLPLFRRQYKATFRQWHRALATARRKQAFGASGLTLLSALAAGSALFVGVRSVMAGTTGVGGIVLLIQSAGSLQHSLALLTEGIGMLQGSLLYFRDFEQFLAAEPGIRLPKHPKSVEFFEEIRFDNVSFAYPNGRVALRSASFCIRKGERLAIVGPNGAGKTTVVKLLLRFHDPTNGKITVDGVDLAEIDIRSWRRLISAVFQNFGRYAFSLRENIEMGDLATAGDLGGLRNAATKGGAERLLDRLGEDTMLAREFGGTDLSMGEWQRIALSRAFFRRAELIVLDEPTASVDPQEEAHLYERFSELARANTSILITHRLGSVRQCERIIVLDEGRLVEEGTHGELIARGGLYAELWRLQAGSYTEDQAW